MDLGLRGRRALVTAGSRGIGRSIASCLAREGAHVAVVARSSHDLDALMSDIGGVRGGHMLVAMDLAEDDMPERLVSRVADDFGPLDIVAHSLGGTLDITDPFCSAADWRRVWRVNLEVAVSINRLVLPGMCSRGWGRVVHISSIAAMENQGPVPYCSMKAALTAYTRSMGRVVASRGVVMTAVLPGAVFTKDGYWDMAQTERPDHVRTYLAERMAIRRFGDPEEIGEAVVFLCSDLASFFVGSIVPIDGGQGRCYFGQ